MDIGCCIFSPLLLALVFWVGGLGVWRRVWAVRGVASVEALEAPLPTDQPKALGQLQMYDIVKVVKVFRNWSRK
jgi:hypothetical protein